MVDPDTLREAHRRAKRGVPPQFPVAQLPNAPLLVAWAALLAARRAPRGRAGDAALALHLGAFAVWAFREAADGVNWFRRTLGVGGLAYVVVRSLGRRSRGSGSATAGAEVSPPTRPG